MFALNEHERNRFCYKWWWYLRKSFFCSDTASAPWLTPASPAMMPMTPRKTPKRRKWWTVSIVILENSSTTFFFCDYGLLCHISGRLFLLQLGFHPRSKNYLFGGCQMREWQSDQVELYIPARGKTFPLTSLSIPWRVQVILWKGSFCFLFSPFSLLFLIA